MFGNNDLPGVMLAGSVRAYINRYAVAPGSIAVLALNHDEAALTIPALLQPGITIAAIIDNRPHSSPQVHTLATKADAPLFCGAQLNRAIGKRAVSGAEILTPSGTLLTIPCDLIAMSGGWNPALQLTSHLNDKPEWDETTATFIPGTLPPNMQVTGAASGQGLNPNILPLWRSGTAKEKAFVDYQNDVAATDVTLAKQEGFRLRRAPQALHHARHGDGPRQNRQRQRPRPHGRGSPVNSIPATGATRSRPPYTPVALGALAGRASRQALQPARLAAHA